MSEKDEKQLEFAVTELFNYYARTYPEKTKDFEQYQNQLFTVGLWGYVAFVNDMQIPVDKKRVVLVWKKSQKSHLAH
jgi:hypothetical protein